MDRYSIIYGTNRAGAYGYIGASSGLNDYLLKNGAMDVRATIDTVFNYLSGFTKKSSYYTQKTQSTAPVSIRYAPLYLHKLRTMPSNIRPFNVLTINGAEQRDAIDGTDQRETLYSHAIILDKSLLLHSDDGRYCYLDHLFGTHLTTWTEVRDSRRDVYAINCDVEPSIVTPVQIPQDKETVLRAVNAIYSRKTVVIRLNAESHFNEKSVSLLSQIYSLIQPRLAAEVGFATYVDVSEIRSLQEQLSIQIFIVPPECSLSGLQSDCECIDLSANKKSYMSGDVYSALELWYRKPWPERKAVMEHVFLQPEIERRYLDPNVFVETTNKLFSNYFFSWINSPADIGTITSIRQLRKLKDQFKPCSIPWYSRIFDERIPVLLREDIQLTAIIASVLAEVNDKEAHGEEVPPELLLDYKFALSLHNAGDCSKELYQAIMEKCEDSIQQQTAEIEKKHEQELGEKDSAIEKLKIEINATRSAAEKDKNQAIIEITRQKDAEIERNKEAHGAEVKKIREEHGRTIQQKEENLNKLRAGDYDELLKSISTYFKVPLTKEACDDGETINWLNVIATKKKSVDDLLRNINRNRLQTENEKSELDENLRKAKEQNEKLIKENASLSKKADKSNRRRRKRREKENPEQGERQPDAQAAGQVAGLQDEQATIQQDGQVAEQQDGQVAGQQAHLNNSKHDGDDKKENSETQKPSALYYLKRLKKLSPLSKLKLAGLISLGLAIIIFSIIGFVSVIRRNPIDNGGNTIDTHIRNTLPSIITSIETNDSTPAIPDKTDLESLLDKAMETILYGNTPSSVSRFFSALRDAESVLESSSDQFTINEATVSLRQALNELRPIDWTSAIETTKEIKISITEDVEQYSPITLDGKRNIIAVISTDGEFSYETEAGEQDDADSSEAETPDGLPENEEQSFAVIIQGPLSEEDARKVEKANLILHYGGATVFSFGSKEMSLASIKLFNEAIPQVEGDNSVYYQQREYYDSSRYLLLTLKDGKNRVELISAEKKPEWWRQITEYTFEKAALDEVRETFNINKERQPVLVLHAVDSTAIVIDYSEHPEKMIELLKSYSDEGEFAWITGNYVVCGKKVSDTSRSSVSPK